MTSKERKPNRRTFVGTVVSDRADKTVTVLVASSQRHPKYLKRYQTSKKYLAHDPQNAYHVNDVVRIRETRPYAKRKRWIVIGKETKQ